MKVTDLSRISVQTEMSAVGPYVPKETPSNSEFYNSDIRMAPAPRMTAPTQTTQPARTLPKNDGGEVREMPAWRKAMVVIGAVCAVVGTIGGLSSIIALGPIGLAIAVGAFAVGYALSYLATH